MESQAAYRNSPQSTNSNSTCRRPITRRIPLSRVEAGAVAATLDDLIEMGFVEKVKDGFGVTRYKPTGGRIA